MHVYLVSFLFCTIIILYLGLFVNLLHNDHLSPLKSVFVKNRNTSKIPLKPKSEGALKVLSVLALRNPYPLR